MLHEAPILPPKLLNLDLLLSPPESRHDFLDIVQKKNGIQKKGVGTKKWALSKKNRVQRKKGVGPFFWTMSKKNVVQRFFGHWRDVSVTLLVNIRSSKWLQTIQLN